MYNEITATIGAKINRVFLQNGFYPSGSSPRMHKHNYTEIHVALGGDFIFTLNDHTCTVGNGGVIMIPSGTYHCYQSLNNECLHSAFQIDLNIKNPEVCSIDPYVVSDYFKEIIKARESGDHTVVSAYISLICSHFEIVNKEFPKPANDYGFSICEFLTQNYNKNIRLCDLAEMLHLSERQAERLVIAHTGKSFKDELVSIRLDMAKHLLATTDMSLGEVAEYVGYKSYAGFWKAMKKYGS